jgi:hypothetical protein
MSMRCHGEVERLDETLASLARAEAGLRLRLGQVLEVLGRGKHFELGFSSIAAYALERCDRSVRWVEAARCLARRLEPLPEREGSSRCLSCGGRWLSEGCPGAWASCWRAWRSLEMKRAGLKPPRVGRCGR